MILLIIVMRLTISGLNRIQPTVRSVKVMNELVIWQFHKTFIKN
jgi:hypothetical protein